MVWDMIECDDNWYKRDKIVFENFIKTPFMNGQWEQVVLFVMVMNDISRSLLVIPTTGF